MIKFYAVIVLTIFSLHASAQIKKNTVLVGTRLSFFSNKRFDEGIRNVDQKSGGTTVLLGKAFKENAIAGISFTFQSTRYKAANSNLSSTETRNFIYGVFYREYKMLAKDLYFFAQADAAYLTGISKDFYTDPIRMEKTTEQIGSLSLTPGISYRIYKKLQLEVTLPNVLNFYYQSRKIRSGLPQIGDSKTETLQFSTSFSSNSGALGYLGVGFHFLL